MKGYNAFFLQVFPRLEATRLVKRLLNHLVFSHIYCLHIMILHIVPLEPLPVKVEPLVIHLQSCIPEHNAQQGRTHLLNVLLWMMCHCPQVRTTNLVRTLLMLKNLLLRK